MIPPQEVVRKERARDTVRLPTDVRRSRGRIQRNLPGWEELWHPLPVSDGEIGVWEHNFTAQQVAICRNGSEEYDIEARHGDLIDEKETYEDRETAVAFAAGLMEGHIEGQVVGNV